MNIDLLLQQTPALPALPQVVQELIRTMSDDDVPLQEVSRKLAADQVLSAKVLRLANSAYYSAPRTVATVDDALRMLGFRTVRSLVVSAGMTGSFKAIAGINMPRFWRYGLHTAVGAKHLARLAEADADLSFTVGLLHALGRLVMAAGMPEDMAALPEGVSPFPGPDRIAIERAAFGFTYADVGAELVKRWNFPDVFPEAVKGAAEPHTIEPTQALHGVVHLAAWRARADEEGTPYAELRQRFPLSAGAIAGLSVGLVLDDMPPLSELSAGLEDLLPQT